MMVRDRAHLRQRLRSRILIIHVVVDDIGCVTGFLQRTLKPLQLRSIGFVRSLDFQFLGRCREVIQLARELVDFTSWVRCHRHLRAVHHTRQPQLNT